MRFTHCNPLGLKNLIRSELARLLSINHQDADPKNTPITSTKAVADDPLAWVIPSPAKIAAKTIIVIGLVIVRINVDA